MTHEEITDSIPQRSDEYTQTEQSTILPFNKPVSTHFFMVLLSGIEPTSNYRYKKAESDSRYTPKNWVGEIYNGTLNDGNSVKANYDIRGRSLYMLSDRNEIGLTEIRIPADNLLVTINNGDKWTRMKTTENGTRIHIVATTLTIKKLYLI